MGKRTCSVEGCDRPHHAGGYCNSHHKRWKMTGQDPGLTPLGTKTSREGTCAGPECSDPILAKRLCTGHYWQQQSGQPLTVKREYVDREGPCLAGHGCDRPRLSEGLCDAHYRRRLRNDPEWDRPINDKAPNGAGHLDRYGYRIISVNGRPMREHLAIAERLLGRPLEFEIDAKGRKVKIEEVHHKNGVRSDNRTDGPFRLIGDKYLSGNLEVWSTKQPKGQEIGPKVRYAIEILRQYTPENLPEHLRHDGTTA